MNVIETQSDLDFLDYMIAHCCRAVAASKDLESQMHWAERLGFYLGKKKAPESCVSEALY